MILSDKQPSISPGSAKWWQTCSGVKALTSHKTIGSHCIEQILHSASFWCCRKHDTLHRLIPEECRTLAETEMSVFSVFSSGISSGALSIHERYVAAPKIIYMRWNLLFMCNRCDHRLLSNDICHISWNYLVPLVVFHLFSPKSDV